MRKFMIGLLAMNVSFIVLDIAYMIAVRGLRAGSLFSIIMFLISSNAAISVLNGIREKAAIDKIMEDFRSEFYNRG